MSMASVSLNSLRVVTDLDEALWRDFLNRTPSANVFHTPEMFEVFSRACNHDPELWAVVNQGSEVTALLAPVHVSLGDGLVRFATTRSLAYGGVAYRDDEVGRSSLRLLLHAYMRRPKVRSLFTELRNLEDAAPLRPHLEDRGFAFEAHLNYLIDLHRPTTEIFGGIGRKTRWAIRRGLREGHVDVGEVASREGLETWYSVLEDTYRHARIPLADRSLFDAALEILRPHGMVRFLLATVGGEPAACSAELYYKDVAYGWYGGTNRSFARFTPNELLTWHVLERSANEGYRVYDFGGAGKPEEDYGVRRFKAKFGGRLVEFGRFVAVHSPRRLRLTKMGYAMYQRWL